MKVNDENCRIRIQDPDPDPLVIAMDPDPHQNVMDPEHYFKRNYLRVWTCSALSSGSAEATAFLPPPPPPHQYPSFSACPPPPPSPKPNHLFFSPHPLWANLVLLVTQPETPFLSLSFVPLSGLSIEYLQKKVEHSIPYSDLVTVLRPASMQYGTSLS